MLFLKMSLCKRDRDNRDRDRDRDRVRDYRSIVHFKIKPVITSKKEKAVH